MLIRLGVVGTLVWQACSHHNQNSLMIYDSHINQTLLCVSHFSNTVFVLYNKIIFKTCKTLLHLLISTLYHKNVPMYIASVLFLHCSWLRCPSCSPPFWVMLPNTANCEVFWQVCVIWPSSRAITKWFVLRSNNAILVDSMGTNSGDLLIYVYFV